MQRRKNRPMIGYKTLAKGEVDLNQVGFCRNCFSVRRRIQIDVSNELTGLVKINFCPLIIPKHQLFIFLTSSQIIRFPFENFVFFLQENKFSSNRCWSLQIFSSRPFSDPKLLNFRCIWIAMRKLNWPIGTTFMKKILSALLKTHRNV